MGIMGIMGIMRVMGSVSHMMGVFLGKNN
jgi:hypothetical protein